MRPQRQAAPDDRSAPGRGEPDRPGRRASRRPAPSPTNPLARPLLLTGAGPLPGPAAGDAAAMRPALPLLLAAALLVLPPLTAMASVPAGQLCRAAVAQAEREAGLPPLLLAAMARVESGRRDPETGRFDPWPWTINAEGRGSFFPDKAAAIAAVRALQAQGVRSIDVGCLQINLRHHPQAFTSLEEAFDPLANARYAARFLAGLQAARGDWMRAAAHYHSQTPELAEAYRERVAAAWAVERGAPEPPPTLAALPRQPQPPAVVAGPAMLSNREERAALLPVAAPGGAGRGLDAYRAMPIPVAGRPPAGPDQRIGQAYISPPSVQSLFSPRSSPIGVFGPRLRSNSSP